MFEQSRKEYLEMEKWRLSCLTLMDTPEGSAKAEKYREINK